MSFRGGARIPSEVQRQRPPSPRWPRQRFRTVLGPPRRLVRIVPLVDQHPPRTKAHEALTPAEVAALRAAADAAGGWRALARAWPEVSAATLARLASGSLATPIVLFVARVRLAQQPAPPSRPGTLRALPASPDARKAHAG